MCSPELRQQIEAFVSIATCGRMRACISSPIYLWINPVRFVAGTVGDFFSLIFCETEDVSKQILGFLLVRCRSRHPASFFSA